MTQTPSAAPPLEGLRILEFAGLGPGPFAGMMLADMGAEVIRIDRPGGGVSPTVGTADPTLDYLARGRRSLALNLKAPEAKEIALRLIEGADGLIEGYRPGVMERLGLGPEVALARNPRLVYGRMTGWGQAGPVSHSAGHDLNYIAITGALWASGPADRAPAFPMNLLGDFGGGGMFLAYGMVAGFLKAARTGQGDVIDAAICDGTHALMAMIHSMRAMGRWQDARQANALDGGVPWYGVYECSDGRWISIGALEPQFWAKLLELLNLDPATIGDRADRSTWPAIRKTLTEVFLSADRDHWCALLEGTDACFAPVLSPAEAAAYPHNIARGAFAPGGGDQPMPAPRFAHAATPLPGLPPRAGQDSRAVLEDAGFATEEVAELIRSGAVACAPAHPEEDPT
ncbi:CaiB/BaiF CoA transferase family protein [Maritimibacter alkaliphilus]|uniref:CaiB/BaiF CoA transferase family protein n=1 Tax=Maritimibacter alkaliphilus TaxID=404236 RepID=UPI001C9636B0|nr:CaiB/BaiF CoA-transferase family protein [Maritimibacter alkaliphilus]MBY6092210.1 CoA transferase [Maritimibacter alkaliphilus]